MRAIALVLLVACGGGEEGTPVDSSAKQFCVDETNRLRTMNGKAAVARSAQLEEFADTGAMVDHGGSPHDHFRQTSGGGIAFAENECPKWSLQQQGGGDMNALVKACIAAFYAEGPGGGHYDNMMGAYASLGCGIYNANGSVTIIQDFGR